MASARPSQQLRVGIVQDGRILEEHLVKRGDVSIGSDGRNTIVLPESELLPARFALLEQRNGQYQLVFDEWMKGRVPLGDSDADLVALRQGGQAQPRGDVFVLALPPSARGKVDLGDVTLFFQLVDPLPADARPQLPADIRGAVWKTMDRVFFGVLAVSLLLHFSGAAVILSRPTPKEPELTLDELPDRFVRALIPQKAPEPERPADTAQADSGKPEEDKKPEKKDPGEAQAAAARPADAQQRRAEVVKKVSGKGLLKVLTASGGGAGGGAFADLLGGSTGGGEVAEALAGAGGVGVATEASVGAGGGPRGGGTGSVSSIGEVGTSGGGKVDLGDKKEVQVQGRVKDAPPEVDSADVDRNALARYVKARIKSLQSCYEKELKRNPNLKGKLVVRFTIRPNGRTGDIDIEEDTLGNDAVGACIRSYIRGWVFPFKPEDEVPVVYPFVFSPAG